MLTIKANTLETDELEKELLVYKRKAFPFAVRNTLNRVAADAASKSKDHIGKHMIERNRWTRGSVRHTNAQGISVGRMRSETGSTQDYMKTQEQGGTKVATGKHGAAIPTSYAAGQESGVPRTRMVRRPNRLNALTLHRLRYTGASEKQSLIVQVSNAVATNRRVIYLSEEHGMKRKGLYRVVGGRKRGHGWPTGAKLKMMYDLSKKSIHIPREPWLSESSRDANKNMPLYYRESLIQQLKRWKLFR